MGFLSEGLNIYLYLIILARAKKGNTNKLKMLVQLDPYSLGYPNIYCGITYKKRSISYYIRKIGLYVNSWGRAK